MMKKFFSMMVALAAVLTFAACEEPNAEEKVALEKPVLSITNQTADSFTVSWKAVSHADNYFVECRGVGENINSTEKTFTGLAAGQYTVKVMAVAKAGSKYTDSDYAEITCTIAGGDDWFSMDVYLDTDEEFGATPSNSFFVDMKGSDVAMLDFAVFYAEDSSKVSDTEILGMLKDGSEYIADVNAGGTTVVIAPVEGSTTFEAIAYATGKAGQTKLIRKSITTEAAQVSDGVAAWLGTWVGTCSKTFTWSLVQEKDGLYLNNSLTDAALDVTLTIQPYDQDPTAVIIVGFSRIYNVDPALGIVGDDGALYILAGVSVGGANGGFIPTWVPCCEIEGYDDYYLIQGQFEAIRFVNNGGNVTSEWLDVELSDGSIATPVHMDIYAAPEGDGDIQIYGAQEDFPMDLYAGDFTLTKSSTASIKKAAAKTQFPTTTMPTVVPSLVY